MLTEYERELAETSPDCTDVLLVRRLRKAVRGFRELTAVLQVIEKTCPFCWDNDSLVCTCEREEP